MPMSQEAGLPILVVDDETSVLTAFTAILESGGYPNVRTIQNGREVTDFLARQRVAVVLLDLMLPGTPGQELIPSIREIQPEAPIVVISGHSDARTAVRCLKMGAYDYLVKPVEAGKLLTTVAKAMEKRELEIENLTLKDRLFSTELRRPEVFSDIVTEDHRMLAIFRYVEAIAETSKAVLMTGETGVGKELIARCVHMLSRSDGPFVAVNVAGFDDALFADTLFGHAAGAYTGADRERPGLVERAGGGTLFLDEIGDLSRASQLKLLRLLESNEYLPLGKDVSRISEARIVVATNRDLSRALDQGEFRKDLFYRLSTHHVHLPPLRERSGDIPLLVEHFVEQAARELGRRKPPRIPEELVILLENHSFPGNVRELQAMVFDAVSSASSGTLSLERFRRTLDAGEPRVSEGKQPGDGVVFPEELPTIREMTDLLVQEALARARGRQTIAARLLGITQQALSKRLKRRRTEEG